MFHTSFDFHRIPETGVCEFSWVLAQAELVNGNMIYGRADSRNFFMCFLFFCQNLMFMSFFEFFR